MVRIPGPVGQYFVSFGWQSNSFYCLWHLCSIYKQHTLWEQIRAYNSQPSRWTCYRTKTRLQMISAVASEISPRLAMLTYFTIKFCKTLQACSLFGGICPIIDSGWWKAKVIVRSSRKICLNMVTVQPYGKYNSIWGCIKCCTLRQKAQIHLYTLMGSQLLVTNQIKRSWSHSGELNEDVNSVWQLWKREIPC